MRLNLDRISHPIHCYFPASGQKYFDRLRHCAIYHDTLKIIEHPVSQTGVVHDDGKFKIEAAFLEHGVDNVGWRVTEANSRKFDDDKLGAFGIKGPLVKQLQEQGSLEMNGKIVSIDEVSWIRRGDSFAVVIDTLPCKNAVEIAKDAALFLCESTYLEEHQELARRHSHLTAKQAAMIAKEAGVRKLILTHFSARYQCLKLFEKEARTIFPHTYAADDLLTFQFKKTSNKI